MKLQENIRRILREETEQYTTPVVDILKTLYPNFNKENASIRHAKNRHNEDVILYDDPETGFHFCSYWINYSEITLNDELGETFDSYLNTGTWHDDLLNWFNSEFNKDAEYMSY